MRFLLSKSTRLFLLVWFWSISVMAAPAAAQAEMSLSFTPIEEAKFLIKGAGWEDATSVEVTIDYDTTYLTAPESTIMGGILRGGSHPDATPGRLQLTAINDGQSPNFEVCIFFQKQGRHPAVINFVTAEVTGPAEKYSVPVEMKPNPNTPQLNNATSDRMKPTEQSQITSEGERAK
jgi:hypothetical protein